MQDPTHAVTVPPNGPPSQNHAEPSMNFAKKNQGEPRGLTFYLLYACAAHALAFLLTGMAKPPVPPPPLPETKLEFMTVEAEQPLKEEVAPAAADNKPEAPPEPAQPQPVQKFVPEPRVEPQPVAPPTNTVAEDIEALDEVSPDAKSTWTVQAKTAEPTIDTPVVQKDPNALAKSVAGAVRGGRGRPGVYGRGEGVGPGLGGGPGGIGKSWGVTKGLPMVSGVGPFGSGSKGALKGTLCFLPPDTRSLAQVSRCTPEGIMYTDRLNIPKARFSSGFPGVSERFEWFAVNYVGDFTVKESGRYVFRLVSDDGSILWVNGKVLINNDGLHNVATKSSAIDLPEGKHKIRVFYFQGPRVDIALQLFVTPPNGTERLWGPSL